MKRIIISLSLGLTFALALLVLLPPGALTGSVSSGRAADGIIYVDCNVETSGDGETWPTAYKSLQEALAAADADETIEQIWVAAGVYTPTNEASPNATFQLIDDVAIYGGFAGGEENIEDRNWQTNLTILSGDLDGNDETPDGIVTDVNDINGTNAYHVVTGSGVTSTASLDGFTITAGDASTGSGGGMFNDHGSPTLRNIAFSGNRSSANGGGLYNASSYSILTNVTFSNNRANGNGGGMANWESSPTLSNVAFNDNQAHGFYGGGGMYNHQSHPQLTHVRFEGNEALRDPSDGGGMLSHNFSTPSLTDVVFANNYARRYGGGMSNEINCNITLTDVIFMENLADDFGGGMMSFNNNNAKLTNVIFKGNQGADGGGMYNSTSDATLTNVLFSGNRATRWGGGMRSGLGDTILINVTFSGNYADDLGGGLYQDGGYLFVANAIMWGNDDSTEGPAEVYINGEVGGDFVNSDITGWTYLVFDPWFIDPVPPDQAPTTAGNYHLRPDSLAIDNGENLSVTVTTDLDGRVRIVDSDQNGTATVDMGVYEYAPIYVDQNAQGPEHNGLTWTSAYTNIQKALDVANPGDEIWVAEGVYYPDEGEGQTDNDPSSTFELIPGVKLYGGFAGGNDEEEMDDRDWMVNITILSGDLDDDDGTINDIVTDVDDINGINAYSVVTSRGLTETARLDGFTITAGSATGTTGHDSGGGMINFVSSPTIANLTFIGNRAINGGGIHSYNSKSFFINVIFSNNQADGHGGGMHNYYSTPKIVNTLFGNNQAANGGGMYNDDGSDVKLVNVTFGGNQATDGGAIHTNDSQASLANAILWGNQSDSGGPTIYNTEESTTSINYSTIEDELFSEGEGNLRQDPLFINPGEGNYRPATDSPVFDKGSNAILTETISTIITDTTNLTDLDGNPRFVDVDEDGNTIVDMGAYELQSLLITYDLTVTLAGSGLGSVSSEPAGISCPGNCTSSFPESSVITLTATSSAGASFTGWDVASCGANPTCPITLDADQNVIATFTLITESEYHIYLPLVVR